MLLMVLLITLESTACKFKNVIAGISEDTILKRTKCQKHGPKIKISLLCSNFCCQLCYCANTYNWGLKEYSLLNQSLALTTTFLKLFANLSLSLIVNVLRRQYYPSSKWMAPNRLIRVACWVVAVLPSGVSFEQLTTKRFLISLTILS